MTNQTNEVRVGLTLVLAMLVLVVGILWLGGFSMRDDAYELVVLFREVGGLNPTDKVTVAGLEAGEVVSLELVAGDVVVGIRVRNDILIPVDSRFSVSAYGFLGAKHVAVRPGTSNVYFEPGAVITGETERGLNDVVDEMGSTLTEIRAVLRAADAALTDVEGKERVRQTLENAAVASDDIRVAVADLKVVATSLRTFVDENRGSATNTVGSMESASEQFAEVTAKLDTIASSLDSILVKVERGDGTLGRLINDPTAHDDFTAAVKEVRDLVAEIRRNPKSFVKFSLF